jgi:hypothetical protein
MKLTKVVLVTLLVILFFIPSYSLAKFKPDPSPEPQSTEESQPSKLEANPEKISIYVFSLDVLGLKIGKKLFPVFINGLLITSLDYCEYVHYEISETSLRVATLHLWVSTTKHSLLMGEGSSYVANTVYSSAKIEEPQLGEVYCFEIINNGNRRVKLITNVDAEKRLKKFKEQEL